MHACGGDMERIAASDTREDAGRNELLGEGADWIVEVEKRDAGEQLKAFRCLCGFAVGCLVENELRGE